MALRTIILVLAGLAVAPAFGGTIVTTTSAGGSVDYGSCGHPRPCTIERSVTLEASGLVEDVDVSIDFFFSYNEGALTLRHNGISVDIFQNVGTGYTRPGGLYEITLDDEATQSLSTVPSGPCCSGAHAVGSYRPDAPLSAFDGMNAFGDWTMIIADWDSSDFTTLRSFTLRVTVPVRCPRKSVAL